MQNEIIFQTELQRRFNFHGFISTETICCWREIVLQRQFSFLTYPGPDNTKMYVLDYFLQTKA